MKNIPINRTFRSLLAAAKSEETQKEMEQSKAENEQGEERAVFSVFGNAPIYKLSDEQKTASFSYGTGAYYQDELLYELHISMLFQTEKFLLTL